MPTTRRNFLGATTAAATLAAQAGAQQTASPNDRLQIALIGAGDQGMGDLRWALAAGGVEMVAAADVYDGRLERCKELWGKQVFTTRDYREILARPDVDCVIVATPDHWHTKISVDAMNAGKDVYLEKPMIQKVEEGRAIIESQNRNKRILQVGSQRVSSVIYQKAKQLLEEGAIGEVNFIEAWWDRNSAIGAWQYSIPLDASPRNIDWDRFLGHAPKRNFEPIRLFRWRNYQDYGTGVAGDLFVHLFSGMHFITGAKGPNRIFSTGGLRFWKDGRDVPDVMLGLFDYPASGKLPPFTLALRVNFVCGGPDSSGFRFVGSEGVMNVGSQVTLSKYKRPKAPGYTVGSFAEAAQKAYVENYRKEYGDLDPEPENMRLTTEQRFSASPDYTVHPPREYNDSADHLRNFIESVRTRKPVIENAEFGLRAAGPAVLCNASYFEGKVVEWDPQTMTRKA
jgi:predicted dehydrogenase